MKRVYLLPNIITAFGLACGLFVIFRATHTPPGEVSFHVLKGSAMLILLAAIADVCDGAVARILHAESEFGGHFDSLADGVTFGIAPSVIVLNSFSFSLESHFIYLITVISMIFSLCGVLRLVRFNVKSSQAKESPEEMLKHKKNFIGLPIPASALAAVSFSLFLMPEGFFWSKPIPQEIRAIIMMCVMLVLGYFMISRWKFPSVKTLHFRIHSIYLIILTALLAFLFLYGILYFFILLVFLATWGYILAAWTLSITRSIITLIAGRKSKTLEDFEPDTESDETDL